MTAIVHALGVSKRFGSVDAVRDVTFDVAEHSICGLLGRNGAGKTTLMNLLTGQEFADAGAIRIFGASPVENASVLSRTCFIKESQVYPEGFCGKHVLRAASWVYPKWDHELAGELIKALNVPVSRRVKKMSRGQRSALGVTLGLASRAELTIFDEPYAGLDAVARHTFYDFLLRDYAEHPRTVLMSTHLIDEAADLLDHVLLIDEGRLVIDSPAEELRGSAVTVSGATAHVERFVENRHVLTREVLGGLTSATVTGLSSADKAAVLTAGLELAPVSLQQLIIGRTRGALQQEVAS